MAGAGAADLSEFRRGSPPRQTHTHGRTPTMADVGLVALTILLFGLLALAVKGAERL